MLIYLFVILKQFYAIFDPFTQKKQYVFFNTFGTPPLPPHVWQKTIIFSFFYSPVPLYDFHVLEMNLQST